MRKQWPLLIALALATPVAAGDSPYTNSMESVLTLRVDGDIEIDANGNVTSHKLHSELPGDMQALMDKAIARWKFLPPTAEGKPIDRARSRMRIAVVAHEVENNGEPGLIVKIENVTFPPSAADPAGKPTPPGPTIERGRMPRFTVPADVLITIHLQYDGSGKVLNIAPSQCTVLALGRGTDGTTACEMLERESVSAIRNWKVDNVKPGTVAETGTVVLKFVTNRMTAKGREAATGEWRRELRSPYRPAPWEKPDAPRVGTSDVEGSGLVTRTAGLTLLEGIGKAL